MCSLFRRFCRKISSIYYIHMSYMMGIFCPMSHDIRATSHSCFIPPSQFEAHRDHTRDQSRDHVPCDDDMVGHPSQAKRERIWIEQLDLVLLIEASKFAFKSCLHLRCIQCHPVDLTLNIIGCNARLHRRCGIERETTFEGKFRIPRLKRRGLIKAQGRTGSGYV